MVLFNGRGYGPPDTYTITTHNDIFFISLFIEIYGP